MRKLSNLLHAALLLAVLLVTACHRPEAEVPEAGPAIYYWRTDLTLTDCERDFLRTNEVRKVYLHLFDVVRRQGQLQPDATTTFTDTLPTDVKVIPVVFLAPDVMQDSAGIASLPLLIAQRVVQMMEQNGLAKPDELQLDFDWTKRNQSRYFALLGALRQELRRLGIPRLSTTIRLHQLAMEAPPVDYGSLMVYNVGNYAKYDERCSILTPQLVEPYLRYLPKYRLPLCAALPIYSWDLLYHRQQFECIVRGIDLSDTASFIPLDAVRYRSIAYQPIPPNGVTMRGDGRILPGDVIRHEQVSAASLDSVRQMLHQARPSLCSQVILYHLDETQIKQYSNDELQALYRGR